MEHNQDHDDRIEDHVSAAYNLENVGQDGCPDDLQKIIAAGPWGAMIVALVAVAGLLAFWLIFFFIVFLPRGSIG